MLDKQENNKQENNKAKMIVQIKTEKSRKGGIKEIISEIAEIEKEYNCKCTLIQIDIVT